MSPASMLAQEKLVELFGEPLELNILPVKENKINRKFSFIVTGEIEQEKQTDEKDNLIKIDIFNYTYNTYNMYKPYL